mmetsp:Transcript_19170/g.60289  ORF Transcript_19170/g.60289 Transcript_19170/m.60289 type:complete len:210 (-) Transcript_19170:231-860(-)
MGSAASSSSTSAEAPAPPPQPRSERVTYSYSTFQRREARRLQREHAYRYALLLKYDKSRTGSLSRDEVKELASDLLKEYTPQVGGLSDEDIDLIMRIGGETCETQLSADQLPIALAVMDSIKASNKEIVDLFTKYDVNKTGVLPVAQLEALLTEIGGEPTDQKDLEYVLKKVGASAETGISAAELKAALGSWYCCCAEHDPSQPCSPGC